MSHSNVDLWPEDIKPQGFLSPREILDQQAEQLAKRMNGLLVGEVIEDEQSDRRVLRFEVVSLRADTRVKLFEIHQQKKLAYPVAVIPPNFELPEFLSKEYYRPGLEDLMKRTSAFSGGLLGPPELRKGQWVKNDWVASTPLELSKLLRSVLEMPVVKSTVISLLSDVDQYERENLGEGDSGN